MTKQISIILPVYNVEQYIRRCVRSIINQSIEQFEVILIDDGSSDDSGLICDELASEFDNVIVYHKSNGGVSSARNLGIEKATGDYIAFIDPDDYILPNSLDEILKEAISADTDIMIAKTYKFSEPDSSDKKSINIFHSKLLGKTYSGRDLYFNNIAVRNVVWGVLFRSSFIKNNHILFVDGIKNGEDSLFMAYCYVSDAKVAFCDTSYYMFYQREGSATHSWTRERLLGYLKNIEYYLCQVSNYPYDSYYRHLYDYLIYGAVSSVFYNLNNCYSNSLRKELVNEIRSILKNHNILLGPIKRNRLKIALMKYSINIFSYLSRIAFNIRNLIGI